MRGEQQRYLVPCPAVPGITPACAGSSKSRHIRPSNRRDHPRMRGEQETIDGVHAIPVGSPPHARGAEIAQFAQMQQPGITPACAGSSYFYKPL